MDLTGRAVRTLLDRVTLPGVLGSTPFTWDGRDDDGSSVAPGVYLALLEAGGQRTGLRIPFLR